jgi:F0F1-type ATP synthase membrane subunit b/b'
MTKQLIMINDNSAILFEGVIASLLLIWYLLKTINKKKLIKQINHSFRSIKDNFKNTKINNEQAQQ